MNPIPLPAKALARLPFRDPNEWRSRWCQAIKGTKLHRVRCLGTTHKKWREFPLSGRGQTVCGLIGKMWMPGFVSRLSAKRCPQCCKLLGIPNGVGAPYNDPTLFPPEGSPIPRSTSAPPSGEKT